MSIRLELKPEKLLSLLFIPERYSSSDILCTKLKYLFQNYALLLVIGTFGVGTLIIRGRDFFKANFDWNGPSPAGAANVL